MHLMQPILFTTCFAKLKVLEKIQACGNFRYSLEGYQQGDVKNGNFRNSDSEAFQFYVCSVYFCFVSFLVCEGISNRRCCTQLLLFDQCHADGSCVPEVAYCVPIPISLTFCYICVFISDVKDVGKCAELIGIHKRYQIYFFNK